MRRERKFSDEDRQTLDRVIRLAGKQRVYYLLVAFGTREYQYKRGDWPNVLPFVRDMLRYYTSNAIMEAMETSEAEKYIRPSRRKQAA